MITAFEATILGFLTNRQSSRYEIMKAFQTTSFYWSGSPGAVYSAIGRLEQRELLRYVDSEHTKTYEITDLGKKKLQEFLKVPVPATKLLVDPTLLRIKLRGLEHLSTQDGISFCEAQLIELISAKDIVIEKRQLHPHSRISLRLADLALAQLDLEWKLVKELHLEFLDKGAGEP